VAVVDVACIDMAAVDAARIDGAVVDMTRIDDAAVNAARITTARSGSPLARSGARRDVEDARRAVELPPPMLGRRLRDRGLAVAWRTQDGWWCCHRLCWVIARQIGATEDARWALALPPLVLRRCSPNWGATARWKVRGGMTGPCLHAGWVAGGWHSPVRKLQEVDGG
jgi:hypothetical protein